MHDGVMPNSFTANTLLKVPNEREGKEDMKKENRRKAAPRVSFAKWLRYRARAEEEEMSHIELQNRLRGEDDEFDDDEDFGDDEFEFSGDEEDPEFDDYEDDPDDEEYDDYDEEDDPEEFDDYGEERELDFDDDSSVPFPIGRLTDFYRLDDEDEDFEEETSSSGFSDFYRDREEEEEAPGGFNPGMAVGGNAGGMGKPAIERAHILFKQVMNLPDMNREKMIQLFMQKLGITESTAISYYEDIAREMGLYDRDENESVGGGEEPEGEGPVDQLPGDTTQELSQEDIDSQNPNSQGIKRTVPNAHMVYKRQQEDGTFEELWIYNIGDKMDDSLKIRREILSGTDIPRGHTRSEDGKQSYTLQTMGNAQMLHITGLPN